MIKLQHPFRREGGITVESTRYELDADGIVTVSEEHAEMLSRVGTWAPPSPVSKKPQKKAAASAPASDGAGRAPRSKQELEALAQAEGLGSSTQVPASAPSQGASPSFSGPHAVTVEVTAEEPMDEAEAEMMEVEITPDMTLAQLKAVGKQLGLKIPRGITQPELYTLLQSQGVA